MTQHAHLCWTNNKQLPYLTRSPSNVTIWNFKPYWLTKNKEWLSAWLITSSGEKENLWMWTMDISYEVSSVMAHQHVHSPERKRRGLHLWWWWRCCAGCTCMRHRRWTCLKNLQGCVFLLNWAQQRIPTELKNNYLIEKCLFCHPDEICYTHETKNLEKLCVTGINFYVCQLRKCYPQKTVELSTNIVKNVWETNNLKSWLFTMVKTG